MRKRSAILLISTLVVVLLAGIGSIIAVADSNSDATIEKRNEKNGVYVDVYKVAASVLNITEDEVKTATKDGKVGDLLVSAGKVEDFKIAYLYELQSKLDAAVTAGKLSQEEADAKYASGEEKIAAYDGSSSLRNKKSYESKADKSLEGKSGKSRESKSGESWEGKSGESREGKSGKRHGSKKDFKKSGVRVNTIKITASVLDQTEDEVKTAIKNGKVGDLLVAADKVDDFKTAYLTELQSKLDAAVKAETLTQEEADVKYASEKEKIDDYDGTTHLCGGKDHSKMFDKKSKKSNSD